MFFSSCTDEWIWHSLGFFFFNCSAPYCSIFCRNLSYFWSAYVTCYTQVTAINTAMAALTKTVGVFPKERAIVGRERAKGSYKLGPYLLSKLLAEIPVGAAFPLMFGAVLYPMARLHPTLSR